MSVELDHLMVPSRNKVASAKLLAELLGVQWSETGVGPFAPVYVNEGLTIGHLSKEHAMNTARATAAAAFRPPLSAFCLIPDCVDKGSD